MLESLFNISNVDKFDLKFNTISNYSEKKFDINCKFVLIQVYTKIYLDIKC